MEASELIRQYNKGKRVFRRGDLMGAYLSRAYLSRANLSGANLSKANLSKANLSGANLSGANLSGANLSGADLSGADLSGADLSQADLSQSIGLKATLTGATLTGAIVKNWNINNLTNFDEVICDYIFLEKEYRWRQPAIGEFASGDFSIVLQAIINENVDTLFMPNKGNTTKIINTEKYFDQSGNIAIGNMSGGTIEEGAKVAGVINEGQEKNLDDVAAKIEDLLNYFQENDPPVSQAKEIVQTTIQSQPELEDASIIEATIINSPTLKQRIKAAGEAAYLKTVKILLPPLGVAIEAFKG